jgi:hypothetical protein
MAFLITRDFITRKGETGYGVGVHGPRTARPETLRRLDAGEGEPFRMLDDDQIVYYHGRVIDDHDAEDYHGEPEFQPLDCYGTPNAGAVWVQYRDATGTWTTI